MRPNTAFPSPFALSRLRGPLLLALLIAGLTACRTTRPEATQPPPATTAAVGVNLSELQQSLASARGSLTAARTDLSDADAKAVRIQESIRNW